LTISYGYFQNNRIFNFSFSLFFLIIILTFANKLFVDSNLTEGTLCLTNKKKRQKRRIMVKQVEKRDGRIVKFNRTKIVYAIQSAMEESGEIFDLDFANLVANDISKTESEIINVDLIHKQVEKAFSKAGFKKSLKKYKSYRTKRDIARKAPSRKAFKDIINAKASDVTRENANMNADTPAGMMMKFASENTKPYVMDVILSERTKEAVENNLIHIHDLDYFPSRSLTCLQHSLDRLFEGFNAGHGSCRSPKRIETAAIQACISMETIQNEMHTLNCAA
jgi:ribonucleoside-triphosphate reductase